MSEKIKILFVSANPSNTSRIRVDEEVREIFEKIEEGPERESFELFKYPALRPGDLMRLMLKHTPHIVHFSGHGSQSKKIVLEGPPGRSKLIEPKALVEAFEIFKDKVRLIVLNACLTREQARSLTRVIDYAVGINAAIGDRAAVKFAGSFYRALAFRMPIPIAFKTAVADLGLQGIPHSKVLELFSREGVDEHAPFPPPEPPRPEAHGAESERLQTALRHLAADTSRADEVSLVREAILDGRLILEPVDEIPKGHVSITEIGGAGGGKRSIQARVHPVTYEEVRERLFPPPPGLAPPLPGLIVVGREDSLGEVKGLLQSASAKEPGINLTVVRGWPGVGKTTLVGVLGRDQEILKAFPEGVLWTSLERKPEVMTKLAEWGRILGTNEFLRIPTVDEAVAKLAALIRHRQMLLIVDDIWDPSHAVPFLEAATGSRCAVLATTRKKSVAVALTRDESRIYWLPELSEESALVLLRYLVPSIVGQYAEKCRELVYELGYLPLALVVAGRLLREEAEMGLNIEDMIEGIKEGAKLFPEPAPLDRAEGDTRPTVRALFQRSTDDLDETTRNCFALLGPFAPKPATFDLAAMKFVWQMDDPKPVIRKLVGHGLLEPVAAGRFQMHELLVKHAYSLLQV
jgi:hypothetical protein